MRYYSSVASSKVLDSPVSNVATSITLNNVTGLPITYPYTLVIEPDTGNEEIVLVTGGSGSTLTVVRGENTDNGVKGGDGTSARAHDAGVVVKHMVTARDLQEPQNHMNAATLVHGLGVSDGAVVGVDKTQTLTNKTLTSPTLNGTPTAPTATTGTNTTQIATTAFVQDAIGGSLTTLSNSSITAGTNWSISSVSSVVKRNNVVYAAIFATYSGATMNFSATGERSSGSGTVVSSLPAGWIPVNGAIWTGYGTGASSIGQLSGQVTTNSGEISISNGTPNASIESGDTIRLYAVYTIA